MAVVVADFTAGDRFVYFCPLFPRIVAIFTALSSNTLLLRNRSSETKILRELESTGSLQENIRQVKPCQVGKAAVSSIKLKGNGMQNNYNGSIY